MTHYYYDSKANKFYGPLDRMPPDKLTAHDIGCTCTICIAYLNRMANFLARLSCLPSHPHTFTGHSRVVPEGEIEWRYKITTTKGWKECTEETYNILPDVQRRRVATPKITGGPELPNLSASTANLSQIKNKDEWLKDVRGESPGYTSTSGEEVGQTFEEYENGDFIHRPPLGLLPKWRHDELRLQEIQEAIDRYSADGKDIPKEWANEMAILISPPPPSPQPEEKDMQVYELNVVLYSLIRFAQRVVNKYPDEFKDGKDRIEKAQYIASKYHKPEDTLRIVQSAPPTQSDQEAAEKGSQQDAWEWVAIFYGALKELCDLKKLKDAEGKTDDYNERQPKAWYLANSSIELWAKSDYGALPIPAFQQAGLEALANHKDVVIVLNSLRSTMNKEMPLQEKYAECEAIIQNFIPRLYVILSTQQPNVPVKTLRTDEEAADDHMKEGGWQMPIHAEIRNAFLAGCNHVRGQQPVDAVAFAEWIIENGYKSPGGSVWYNIYEEKETLINSQKLYALFTARHPTPKPEEEKS